MRLTDKNKTLTYSEENQINLARRKNGIKIKSWYYGKPIERLAEFEDLCEKYNVEDLWHLDIMLFVLSGETKYRLKEIMEENQALKDRWENLKEFVNMPKEIQQWDERFEVTVDSIKAKMQELELADLIRKKGQ